MTGPPTIPLLEALGITIFAAMVSFALTPWVRRLACRYGAIDRPGPRKVHRHPIPRLGGLAIAAAGLGAVVTSWQLLPELAARVPVRLVGTYLIGSLFVLGIGALDDLSRLSALPKLLVQLAAATVAVAGGFVIERVTLPGVGSVSLGWLAYPATIGWIVLVTNAYNLIDGLDGLATTLASIAATLLAVALLLQGFDEPLLLLLPLLGAVVGFLPHNMPPARIFLGDSGSYLIGYQLALLSLWTGYKSFASFAIFAPIAILGLPIVETLFTIGRRLVRPEAASWRDRLAGVVRPDRAHIHHRALDRGWSTPRAVLSLALLSSLLGVSGLLLTLLRSPFEALLLVVVTGGATGAYYWHMHRGTPTHRHPAAPRGVADRVDAARGNEALAANRRSAAG